MKIRVLSAITLLVFVPMCSPAHPGDTPVAQRVPAKIDIGPSERDEATTATSRMTGRLDPKTGEELHTQRSWVPSGWLGWLLCATVIGVTGWQFAGNLRRWRYERLAARVHLLDAWPNGIRTRTVVLRVVGPLLIVAVIARVTVGFTRLLPGESQVWLAGIAVCVIAAFATLYVYTTIEEIQEGENGREKRAIFAASSVAIWVAAAALIVFWVAPDHERNIASEARLIAGQLLRDGQPNAALVHLDRAQEYEPGKEKDSELRAKCYEAAGLYELAVAERQAEIRRHPGDMWRVRELAEMHARLGKRNAARATLRDAYGAVRSTPDNEQRRQGKIALLSAAISLGLYPLAIDFLEDLKTEPAVKDPDELSWDWARIHHAQGDYPDAVRRYQAAINFEKKSRPDVRGADMQLHHLCLNSAWIKATCPDDRVRSPAAAVKLAEEAERWVGPPPGPGTTIRLPGRVHTMPNSDLKLYHGALASASIAQAAAHAGTGDFEKAKACLGRAQSSIPNGYRTLLMERHFADLSAAVNAGRPYREREPAPEPRPAK